MYLYIAMVNYGFIEQWYKYRYGGGISIVNEC